MKMGVQVDVKKSGSSRVRTPSLSLLGGFQGQHLHLTVGGLTCLQYLSDFNQIPLILVLLRIGCHGLAPPCAMARSSASELLSGQREDLAM